MVRGVGPSERGGCSPRVNCLDPETLGLVQSFLDARMARRTVESISADVWDRFYAACALDPQAGTPQMHPALT